MENDRATTPKTVWKNGGRRPDGESFYITRCTNGMDDFIYVGYWNPVNMTMKCYPQRSLAGWQGKQDVVILKCEDIIND